MGIDESPAVILAAAATPGKPLADVTERAFRGPMAAAGLAPRQSQIDLARAVADTIDAGPRSGAKLAAEAPTGTGKSLAYLVPGFLGVIRALAAGRDAARLLVSTSGIPLQRQLVDKDVPAIRRAFGVDVSASILKGLGNYACLAKVEDAELAIGPDGEEARAVRKWLASGGSGDREDVPWPVRSWSAVSTKAELCLGQKCRHYDACPAQAARRAAKTAKIVIANHAYLALAGGKWIAEGPVALIADEAHDLEDSIRRAQSVRITSGSGRGWKSEIMELLGDGAAVAAVDAAASVVVQAAAEATEGSRNGRLLEGWWLGEPEPWVPVREVALAVEHLPESEDDHLTARRERLVKGLRMLATRIRLAVEAAPTVAVWTECDRMSGRVSLEVAPLAAVLPSRQTPTVLCSATLGGGDPSVAAAAVGVPDARSLVVPSPWPLEEMAVAVVPPGPDPKHDAWSRWAAGRVVDFVRRCGGGVLVIASSWRQAEVYAAALRGAVDLPVFLQGERGRSELVDAFRADEDSVLVGTASFRQGVDVQGRACRGVVIDRIPFPQVGDPVEEAIGETLLDAFRERSIPIAAQALRQSVGRLIRHPDDRGAILILDSRLKSAAWARRLREAIAPIPISSDIEDVDRILAGQRPTGAVGRIKPARALSARSARSVVGS